MGLVLVAIGAQLVLSGIADFFDLAIRRGVTGAAAGPI